MLGVVAICTLMLAAGVGVALRARHRIGALLRGDRATAFARPGALGGSPTHASGSGAVASDVDLARGAPGGPGCLWSCTCIGGGPDIELAPPLPGQPSDVRRYVPGARHVLRGVPRAWQWVERGTGDGAVCLGAVTRLESAPWQAIRLLPVVTPQLRDSMLALPRPARRIALPYVYGALPLGTRALRELQASDPALQSPMTVASDDEATAVRWLWSP